MFDKSQREILNKLSDSIWNISNKWSKFYNAGHFDVVVSEEEKEEEVTQLCLGNSKKNKGTIINKTTAINKGLWNNTPEVIKVKHRVKRRPTYDELFSTLVDLSNAALFSQMTNTQLINVLAVDLVAGIKSSVTFKLVKNKNTGESYESDCATLFQKLSPETQEKITALETAENGMPLDYLEFVGEVLFATAHKEAARELCNSNIEMALLLHKKELRRLNAQRRFG